MSNDLSRSMYIGTKSLWAQPMNRRDYVAYRGWDLPKNENGDDEGYLVEYIDGGAPNDPRHQGYISWSPKDVFERAYRPAHTFLERLRVEKAELDDKLTKLAGFIASESFLTKLDTINQHLLHKQQSAMATYASILDNRLKLLG